MNTNARLHFAKCLVVCCLIGAGACVSISTKEPPADAQKATGWETVVLLHGLGRGEGAMWLLASRIERAGLDVVRIGYRSLSDPPEVILLSVREKIDACCKQSLKPVHFVGHSLGGLFIGAYLAENRLRTLGRVVLIATPNAGTPLVEPRRVCRRRQPLKGWGDEQANDEPVFP